MSATAKTWQPTRHEKLYRHKSGTYYVRLGSRTWRSLKTKVLSIALKKRDQAFEQEKIRQEIAPTASLLNIRTVADAIAIRQKQEANNASNKKSTRDFWGHIYRKLPDVWPGLPERELAKVTREECEEWVGRYSNGGDVSPSHFNHVLCALRSTFEIGVEAGVRFTNPFAKIKPKRSRRKDLSGKLPNKANFAKLIREIRNSPSRWGEGCGDLVEFLAYTGLRIGEAKWVLWQHCDFDRGELTITGEPVEGTKNREVRRVPIIADLKELLIRTRLRRGKMKPEDRILEVISAQKAIDRATAKLGLARITHHDFRHLFATTCIESGVDIPTVSKWLGHKDGGALAMRVYGHLRNEHSLAEAKKVSFS